MQEIDLFKIDGERSMNESIFSYFQHRALEYGDSNNYMLFKGILEKDSSYLYYLFDMKCSFIYNFINAQYSESNSINLDSLMGHAIRKSEEYKNIKHARLRHSLVSSSLYITWRIILIRC